MVQFQLARCLLPGVPPGGGETLIDGKAWASVGETAIVGSIGTSDMLVEYTTVRSGDFYRAVRHYRIEGGRVELIAPLALTPHVFVEEWLDLEGTLAGERFSDLHNLAALRTWRSSHKQATPSEFPTMHCTTAPDLWQVSYQAGDRPVYFKVRWRRPYEFTMMSIGGTPDPGCAAPDPAADDQRMLFPAH